MRKSRGKLPAHFKGMKESWNAAEACHCERPRKVSSEGTASVAIGGPGMKWSCKGVEVWHHEESLHEDIGESGSFLQKEN